MTFEMGEALSVTLMGILTMVHFRMVKPMVREFTPGIMVKFMMASGIKDLSMATESGEVYSTILTLENGVHQKLKAMVSIYGRMEIDTKENGSNVSSMGKERISLPMVMFIQENTKKESLMEKASIPGRMARFTLVNLRTG